MKGARTMPGLPHGLGVERLEHDLGQSLAAGLGIEWGLCEENRVPLPRRDGPPAPARPPEPSHPKSNPKRRTGNSKLGSPNRNCATWGTRARALELTA